MIAILNNFKKMAISKIKKKRNSYTILNILTLEAVKVVNSRLHGDNCCSSAPKVRVTAGQNLGEERLNKHLTANKEAVVLVPSRGVTGKSWGMYVGAKRLLARVTTPELVELGTNPIRQMLRQVLKQERWTWVVKRIHTRLTWLN